jgi:redox-sensitive bicupin YhaK (pirin superfamily)
MAGAREAPALEHPMIIVRPSEARGKADHGWLQSRHTFSFADYYDRRHMGFGALRVINEDRVAPGAGFGTHSHRDMEIVSYVLEGALEHKDSIGTGSVIRPGEVQRMSAGTGIAHSEYNASKTAPVHFLQIWLLPDAIGLTPSYEQKAFPAAERTNRLRLVASPDGRDGSLTVRQDVNLYASVLEAGANAKLQLPAARHAWVQVARGAVRVNGRALEAGDGAAILDEQVLEFVSDKGGEFLVFDLA